MGTIPPGGWGSKRRRRTFVGDGRMFRRPRERVTSPPGTSTTPDNELEAERNDVQNVLRTATLPGEGGFV